VLEECGCWSRNGFGAHFEKSNKNRSAASPLPLSFKGESAIRSWQGAHGLLNRLNDASVPVCRAFYTVGLQGRRWRHRAPVRFMGGLILGRLLFLRGLRFLLTSIRGKWFCALGFDQVAVDRAPGRPVQRAFEFGDSFTRKPGEWQLT